MSAPAPAFTREACEQLDRDDPLAHFRDEFSLPDGLIYLDGNSMGAQPKAARERLHQIIDTQWPEHLVGGWLADDWMRTPERCGAVIAQLIGAEPSEVVIADSTSVNLFKALHVALAMQSGRKVILTESGNFPTDLYVSQGIADRSNGRYATKVVARDEIVSSLNGDVAVLTLTHVDYRTAEIHDMAAITASAHNAGVLVVWDLSHSAGAVPIALDDCTVDLAVGCGYKYLNGGPGAPAFIYIAQRHIDAAVNVIPGWLGHRDPFIFANDYVAAPGIRRMISGSPSVISGIALEAGASVTVRAGMDAVRAKSVELCEMLTAGVDALCPEVEIASPRDASRRGSHVALWHPEAYGITQALIAAGVVGDFREPDIVRLAMTPLYLRFVDVFETVRRLRTILDHKAHLDPAFKTRKPIP